MSRRRSRGSATSWSTWSSRGRRGARALDVNRDFDRIGAHYNAFTSEENTVFYAAILPEYMPQAVDVLADILRPSLRDGDFDMEKNVIIEEIGMYEDQPMWSAYDHAKKVYFAEHPLGNSILGSVESIKALTSRPDARLLPAPLRGAEHHRRRGRQLRVECPGWPGGTALRLVGRGAGRPAGHSPGSRHRRVPDA